ncbi:MAG: ROK family protein [Ghiorsea sp.]
MNVLAADVGGTNIRVAILDESYHIIAEQRVEAKLSQMNAQSPKQAEAMLTKLLCNSFQDLIQQYQPTRIGIGFPGFFAGDTGVLISSPNIPLLQNFNLAAAISAATKLPTSVQNDALCAAWGEFHHGIGADLGLHSLMHITLGTGVGAGLILNHSPYAGEHGMAMEFGHLYASPLTGDAVQQCGCGNTSCLETYASATALSTRYHALTGKQLSAQMIAQEATNSNAQAAQVIQKAGHYLGAAIAETCKLLDIKTVSVSGGVTGCWSLLFPAIQDALQARLIIPLRGKVSVKRSQLGDNSGLFGAARLNP